MLKNITLRVKLYIMAFAPILVGIVIILAFILTTNSIFQQMTKTSSAECLEATQLILNADRDAYQALTALQALTISGNTDRQKYINDYNENVSQVFERVGKAQNILSKNSKQWGIFKNKDTNTGLFEEFKMAQSDFKIWKSLSDKVVAGNLSVNAQQKQFDLARAHLNTIGDLVNDGSAQIIKSLNEKKNVVYIVLVSTSIFIFLILALFSIKTASLTAQRLANLVLHIKEVANKNLAMDNFKIDSNDEISALAVAVNTMNDNLKGVITEVNKSIEFITNSSKEVCLSSEQASQGSQQTAVSTQQLAQGSQEIASNIVSGSNIVTKMNSDIQNVASEATIIADLSNKTEVNANSGKEHVEKAVVKINSIKTVAEDISITIAELGKLSAEIEQIVDLIKNIAGQTNLLALNAAIEAARAGEHGKGFAVVADEVKKLAGESADATEKITAMIKDIQSKTQDAVNKMNKASAEVEDGVTVVNNAGNALESIIEEVRASNSKIQGISSDINAAVSSSESVVKMIEDISAITEETAASAEEISSITQEQTANFEEISNSSQNLANIVDNLYIKVSEFKL